jgi:hypothetical protein
MPINIHAESVVTFHDLVKRILPANGGKRVHIGTPHRWRTQGLRGVRLEAIKVGGRWCTSLQALERFFDVLSRGAGLPTPTQAGDTCVTGASAESLRKLQEEGFC